MDFASSSLSSSKNAKDLIAANSSTSVFIVFGKSWCPFCKYAIQMLRSAPFIFVDVEQRPRFRDAVTDKTVPQIFLNGKHIGGSEQLAILLGSS